VVGKLRRSLRAGSADFASRQRTYPRSRGPCAARFGPTSVIVLDGRSRGQRAFRAASSSPSN
jgi:hypothetical protein